MSDIDEESDGEEGEEASIYLSHEERQRLQKLYNQYMNELLDLIALKPR